jgi:hypothetical protein
MPPIVGGNHLKREANSLSPGAAALSARLPQEINALTNLTSIPGRGENRTGANRNDKLFGGE